MKKKKSNNRLNSLKKALQRSEAKKQGFYDGRFRLKVEESAKHKKPRHKGKDDTEE